MIDLDETTVVCILTCDVARAGGSGQRPTSGEWGGTINKVVTVPFAFGLACRLTGGRVLDGDGVVKLPPRA